MSFLYEIKKPIYAYELEGHKPGTKFKFSNGFLLFLNQVRLFEDWTASQYLKDPGSSVTPLEEYTNILYGEKVYWMKYHNFIWEASIGSILEKPVIID